jgi:hypothetical protein
METAETKKHTCRCCNRTYNYPVPRSRTTRFHCTECAALAPGLRSVFEQMNRRLKRTEKAVEKLTRLLSERAT